MNEYKEQLPCVPFIDPKEYGVDFNEYPIGLGESRVHRGKGPAQNKVLKVFAFGFPDSFIVKVSLEQLLKYQKIVDFVAAVSSQLVAPFDTEEVKITFNTIPIQIVGVTQFGIRKDVPASICEFSPGVSLDEDRRTAKILYSLAKHKGVINVSDPEDAVHLFLRSVTDQLRQITGERAIRMEALNIKSSETNYGLNMCITDPCAELTHIKT